MIGKYVCEKCGWQGDEPDIAHPEYGDLGWMCCPNGCMDKNSEPEGVRQINSRG